MIAEVELERPRLTDIQYARREFVIVGEAVAGADQIRLPALEPPLIDARAYHTPLFTGFRVRRRVAELPESDFEPDELA